MVPEGLNVTPLIANGIKSGMIMALKIRAERTAVFNPSPRTFNAFSSGTVDANNTGMIAKYFATSFAMLNVVTAPRVISNCFPSITTSMILAGFDSRSTMFAASFAAWVPEFIAKPTSAIAKAGASLVPSPIIATILVSARSRFTLRYLSSVLASGCYSSIPTSVAMLLAVTGPSALWQHESSASSQFDAAGSGAGAELVDLGCVQRVHFLWDEPILVG